MEIYKEDYELGIRMVQTQFKDALIQAMLAENTLKFLQEKAKGAKPAPKKENENIPKKP